ncbi:MAG: SDR family NAD(P)-dependent oxidoreductase, partial [Bacteroidota bacterium]|nr:SDR family NAD(P)-dependent oxidoreductase [Bacteroidota bacterium]
MKESGIALITGATSGIGKACAEILAANGYSLIITGRRRERLHDIASLLNKAHNVNIEILEFDLRDREGTIRALNSLPELWQNIDLLINNAGLASGLSEVQDGDFEDWDVMLDTNIKGLLNVSRTVMPWMIARK